MEGEADTQGAWKWVACARARARQGESALAAAPRTCSPPPHTVLPVPAPSAPPLTPLVPGAAPIALQGCCLGRRGRRGGSSSGGRRRQRPRGGGAVGWPGRGSSGNARAVSRVAEPRRVHRQAEGLGLREASRPSRASPTARSKALSHSAAVAWTEGDAAHAESAVGCTHKASSAPGLLNPCSQCPGPHIRLQGRRRQHARRTYAPSCWSC